MKKQKAKSKGLSSTFSVVVLVGVILILGAYILSNGKLLQLLTNKPLETTEEPIISGIPTPKPSPKPLAQGKQTWTYAPGPLAKGPKIYEFTLDPLDSKVGQKQTITVKARYDSPITSVSARLDTDKLKKTYTFTRVAGSDTDGSWQATFTVEDAHDYTYYLDFTLVGTPDTYNGGFAFR